MEIFEAHSGYDRRKKPEKKRWRYMTLEEGRALSYGDHVKFLSVQGDVRDVKINGAVKTWKRDADRTEIPFKYGMYEYDYARNSTDSTGALCVTPLVVEVTD